MNENRNSLPDSGLILAIITAFLYCASTAHTGGFNREFGLNGDILDRNFQQILYDGFFVSFEYIIYPLILYTAFMMLYSYIIFPYINNILRENKQRKRQFISIKHFLRGKRKYPNTEYQEKIRTKKAIIFTTIVIVFIKLLVHSQSMGEKEASQVIEQLKNRSFSQEDIITVPINGVPKRLLYLSCGARNCAGIDPDTLVIQYFPQNSYSYPFPAEKITQSISNKSAIK
jgi:hypothetical protein